MPHDQDVLDLDSPIPFASLFDDLAEIEAWEHLAGAPECQINPAFGYAADELFDCLRELGDVPCEW